MSEKFDLLEIIELKTILDENFGAYLNVDNIDGIQVFSVEKNNPSAVEYIKNYFSEKDYLVRFNENLTEFYIEEARTC